MCIFVPSIYAMVTIKQIKIKGYFGKGVFEWNLNPVVTEYAHNNNSQGRTAGCVVAAGVYQGHRPI